MRKILLRTLNDRHFDDSAFVSLHAEAKAGGSSILAISKWVWVLLREPESVEGHFAARSVTHAMVQTLLHQIAYCMGFGVTNACHGS